MKKIGVFYGSDTGCTEAVMEKLKEIIEDKADFHDVSGVKNKDDLLAYSHLILAIPTWYDGELQSDWESFFPDFQKIDFEERKIAIVGLGDQIGYGEFFVDGIGILAKAAMEQQAQLVGLCAIDGYDFEESQALIDIDGETYFLGLPLDEDNQPEMTDDRLGTWMVQVLEEFELEKELA